MKIALIYDEPSPQGEGAWVEAEYESPRTIEALLAAIGAHCEEAVRVPFGPDLIERLRAEGPDLAFNIVEGRDGPSRESIAPAVLDFLGIPYTGSDGVALGISLNKALTKRLASQLGIPTPAFFLVHSAQEAVERAAGLEYPVLVKPNFGGSSVGIGPESIVRCPEALAQVVERELARYSQPCLVEAYVEGEDLTLGLLGSDDLEALPAGKVITPGGIYSELAKKTHEREILCPYDVPQEVEGKLRDWSVKIFRAIGARDFARADYVLGADGQPWFLEINPLPGLSPYYGVLPVLAQAAGYTHSQLIGRIISIVQQRLA